MKRAAVITRHAISNYGSLLQAIATQRVIEEMGLSCEIIDYIRKDETYQQYEKTLLKNKKNWNSNPIKRWLYLLLRQPESVAAGKNFEKMRKKYLKLTKHYEDGQQLRENPPKADVYVTGSDQVWGTVADGEYDDAYCLAFAGGRKIAYAASFGHSQMSDEVKHYYKKNLAEYADIAVREDSAVELLADMGIGARQVLDPTLLLNEGEWREVFDGRSGSLADRSINAGKPYVLVYQIHNDRHLGEYAVRVAKEKGLPLIRVSASLHQISRQGRLVWCPQVAEFLSYIKNAECMITDSFHGTAFAINFNTPFVEVLPNNSTGTRNMSILTLTGLRDRVLKNDDISIADRQINWESVNRIIADERARSLAILKEMLEN